MKNIIIHKNRIKNDKYYYLIIRDNASGTTKSRKYTIYRIPSSPAGKIRIIGRELPLGFAKKFVMKKNK